MTAIWSNRGERWKLLAPAGFPDEATLHVPVTEGPKDSPNAVSLFLSSYVAGSGRERVCCLFVDAVLGAEV